MREISLTLNDRTTALCQETMPVVVILDNLRSAYNVGNIFRVAEATRVQEILACGYTAAPPHEKLKKTARGCDEIVPCSTWPDAASAVRHVKEAGMRVYAVETVEDAPLYWDAPLQFPCAFIFGNEALGISMEALQLCDGFIRLPAFGQKNSINVGNCAAVVLFDCVRRTRM